MTAKADNGRGLSKNADNLQEKYKMKKLLRNLLLFPTLFTSIFSGYGKIMMAVLIISLLLIYAGNVKGLRLDVYNISDSVSGDRMKIVHIDGATEGHDNNYDSSYLDGPWPLHIYSNNHYTGLDYSTDARPANSTTTYNLDLTNTGGFSGTVNNMLRFKIVVDTNFTWKNIFLGDANDSNNIVADIKYVINNEGGDFPLPDVDGSKTGVYDKRKVFFYNHADLNRDRKVNGLDFAIWAGNFGRSEESDPNTFGANVGSDVNDLDAYSDIDRNGTVDYNDLSLFSGEWLWDANDPNTWSRVR